MFYTVFTLQLSLLIMALVKAVLNVLCSITVFTLQVSLLIMALVKAVLNVLYSIYLTTIASHHGPDEGCT